MPPTSVNIFEEGAEIVSFKIVNPDGQEHALPRAFRYVDAGTFKTPDPQLAAVKPGKGPVTGGT